MGIDCDSCFALLCRRCIGAQTGLPLHCRHIFFQFRSSKRTVAGGGHHLTQRLDTHISRRVHAVRTGFLRFVGHNIPLFVQVHNPFEHFGSRFIPGKHENAKGFLALVFRHLTGGGVFVSSIG